jgi:hypothetical protein
MWQFHLLPHLHHFVIKSKLCECGEYKGLAPFCVGAMLVRVNCAHVIYILQYWNMFHFFFQDKQMLVLKSQTFATVFYVACNSSARYTAFTHIRFAWLYSDTLAVKIWLIIFVHIQFSQATATLKPEPTQRNSLDRIQIRKYKSKTLLFMSAATMKPIRLECYLLRLSGVSV